MQCNESLRLIWEEGQGNATQDQAFRLHLSSCADCRQRVDALQAAEQILRLAPLEAPAPYFSARVMDRIAQQRAAAATVPTRQALSGLAVVAAALTTLVVVWAVSLAWTTLLPGGAMLTGLAGFVATALGVLTLAGTVTRAAATAIRALPPELLQVVIYSFDVCCVASLLVVIWMAWHRVNSPNADRVG